MIIPDIAVSFSLSVEEIYVERRENAEDYSSFG
jgi:hypothetical protein